MNAPSRSAYKEGFLALFGVVEQIKSLVVSPG